MVPAAVARYHLQGVNRGVVSFGFNDRVVVIFGFGPGSPDDQGEVAPCVCPNCHNQVFLHHVRSKKSVRLYFVPVVPYGTDDYLVCPGAQPGPSGQRRPAASRTPDVRRDCVIPRGRQPRPGTWRRSRGSGVSSGLNPAGQQPLTLGPAPVVPCLTSQPPVISAVPAPPPPRPRMTTRRGYELHQLSQLHNQGALSDAAYAAAKERILEQGKQPQPRGPASSPTQPPAS